MSIRHRFTPTKLDLRIEADCRELNQKGPYSRLQKKCHLFSMFVWRGNRIAISALGSILVLLLVIIQSILHGLLLSINLLLVLIIDVISSNRIIAGISALTCI
jgi:hypothetical protein